MYLLNPETLGIIHRFNSIKETAEFLGVTKQAVHDALQKGYRCRGFVVFTQQGYMASEFDQTNN